jgi:hypothetical protein
MNELSISIYPKGNQMACLVLKNDNRPYRINFLWQYLRLTAELEDAYRQISTKVIYKRCLELLDRHNKKWIMLLSIAGKNANLVLWFISSDQRHQQSKFAWHGTVAAFRRAVRGMLKRLRFH